MKEAKSFEEVFNMLTVMTVFVYLYNCAEELLELFERYIRVRIFSLWYLVVVTTTFAFQNFFLDTGCSRFSKLLLAVFFCTLWHFL
jgi:hypothetical protein